VRLKVVQLREPVVEGSNRVPGVVSQLVNADTGEPVVGVQEININVTYRGTETHVTILNTDVEMRDRKPGEVLKGEKSTEPLPGGES
jgi:hypothetical protein